MNNPNTSNTGTGGNSSQYPSNFYQTQPGAQTDVSRQLVNEIRIMLANNRSDIQIISAMTMKGFPPNYTSSMIQYVKKIDGSNNNAYSNSKIMTGRLRQIPSQNQNIQNQNTQYQGQFSSQSQNKFQYRQNSTNYSSNTLANTLAYSQNNLSNDSAHGKRNPIVLIIILFLIIGVAFGITYLVTSSSGSGGVNKYSANYDLAFSRTEFSAGNPIEYQSNLIITGARSASIKIENILYNANQDIAFKWNEEKVVDGKLKETIDKEIPKTISTGQYYIFSEATLPDGSKTSARSDYFTITGSQGEVENPGNEQSNPGNENTQNENNLNENNQNANNQNTENENNLNENPGGDNSEVEQESKSNNDQNIALQEMQVKGENQEAEEKEINDKFALALSYIKPPADNAKAASICLEFTESALRDSCMTQLAQTSKNYAFCNEIQDMYSKDYCFLNYVISTKDYEKCNFIENSESKNSCEALNNSHA